MDSKPSMNKKEVGVIAECCETSAFTRNGWNGGDSLTEKTCFEGTRAGENMKVSSFAWESLCQSRSKALEMSSEARCVSP